MNVCPVCSYDQLKFPAYENIEAFEKSELDSLSPPYEEKLGKASYEVFLKCGYEFGNDDDPGTTDGKSFAEYRSEWADAGSKWFDESAM